MNRRKFIGFASASVLIAGGGYYLTTDKLNFVRADVQPNEQHNKLLTPHEAEILYLASLAPSGHNTQPWSVKYLEPYHWLICNDKRRWLPGVDPWQRETILSIGAFLQNLEYAAGNLGYDCHCSLLAVTNQDEDVAEVTLTKSTSLLKYDVQRIKQRRTIRSNYLREVLRKADVDFLCNDDAGFLHLIPNTAKQAALLNEQTIEANKVQAHRDAAQSELADWIRFSSRDAKLHNDGLTLASMEIDGISGWVLRNFYGKADVMKDSFRKQSVDAVVKQVSQSAGWILITSSDNSVSELIATGKRLQRLLLKIRERNIAIHPMTQMLEEPDTADGVQSSIGMNDPIQFILRAGYIRDYPKPVSLRRPVFSFVKRPA